MYLPTLPLVLLSLLHLVSASTTSSSTATTTAGTTTSVASYAGPTPAATNAVHAAGIYGYSYIGCYNETTYLPGGERAVQDGSMQTNNSQTVEACLTWCHSLSYAVCGIEYGRECWGGMYLSTLSAEMPSSNCSVGCVGNLTEFCGGYLTLTVYNTSSTTVTGGVNGVAGVAAAGVLAALLGAAFSIF